MIDLARKGGFDSPAGRQPWLGGMEVRGHNLDSHTAMQTEADMFGCFRLGACCDPRKNGPL